jgi:catalase-peroxidase
MSHQTERTREETEVPERGSESESPAIPSPTPKAHRPMSNQDWWPNQPNLQILQKHSRRSYPMGEDFDYAEAC